MVDTRRVRLDTSKPVFVIEHCVDCRAHAWNTRHDESKYSGMAGSLGLAIKEVLPDATILINQVPKAWYEKDLYCQLIPNDDDNTDVYDMIPRIGAFEVSTVAAYGGANDAILLYSKMIGGMWPHIGTLAKKIDRYAGEMENIEQTKQTIAEIKKEFTFKRKNQKRQTRTHTTLKDMRS